jgi:hypothetical protein
MNHEDIDRMLREDPTIAPSREFAFRVMYSVRHEAAQRQAIPFPWKRLWLGLAASAAVTAAALYALGPGGLARPLDTEAAVRVMQAIAPTAVLLTTALAGSLALVLWSFRLAGR